MYDVLPIYSQFYLGSVVLAASTSNNTNTAWVCGFSRNIEIFLNYWKASDIQNFHRSLVLAIVIVYEYNRQVLRLYYN